MNNFNIHLEIRNPEKQAIGTKLEVRACYLTNRRTKEQGTNNGEPPGWHLGLGLAQRGDCGTRDAREGSRDSGEALVAALAMLATLGRLCGRRLGHSVGEHDDCAAALLQERRGRRAKAWDEVTAARARE